MTTKRMLKAASKAGVPNRLTLHYDTVVYIRAESLAWLFWLTQGSWDTGWAHRSEAMETRMASGSWAAQ